MPSHPNNNPGWRRAATAKTRAEARTKALSKANEATTRPLSVVRVKRTKKGTNR